MDRQNPYAISFGRIPHQYISRDVMLSNITEALDSNFTDERAFKLTGIRGTGKTVMLSAVEKQLRNDSKWIICDIKPGGNIIEDIVSQLYGEVPFIKEYIDANINLSALGIGINLGKKKAPLSLDTTLKKLLREIAKKNKRVLIVIDEVRKTDALVDFIQEFQILIRKELPIFLVAAGLYEDIESLENADGLTFFLRASKYEMTPLNMTYIRDDYIKTLNVSFDVAENMAFMTKGYAYAYQALGKYMWDTESKKLTKEVLQMFDEVLFDKVYKKIWSELAPKDRWYLSFIVKKDSMEATELLEITKTTHSEWSVPRSRLKDKGIIDVSQRGTIALKLPRFKEFVEEQEL